MSAIGMRARGTRIAVSAWHLGISLALALAASASVAMTAFSLRSLPVNLREPGPAGRLYLDPAAATVAATDAATATLKADPAGMPLDGAVATLSFPAGLTLVAINPLPDCLAPAISRSGSGATLRCALSSGSATAPSLSLATVTYGTEAPGSLVLGIDASASSLTKGGSDTLRWVRPLLIQAAP